LKRGVAFLCLPAIGAPDFLKVLSSGISGGSVILGGIPPQHVAA
jgi:hypothetical protein